ncbi:MAG TPA: DUF2283 domain-containing protein [Anaerolineae bacterium]|nr:DUF2283 domain-containing protein [Anaerolineae bacterium]
MKISYDTEADALCIEFHPLAPGTAQNRQLTDELIANYAPNGRLAGLEILDASRVLARAKQDQSLIFQIEPIPALS